MSYRRDSSPLRADRWRAMVLMAVAAATALPIRAQMPDPYLGRNEWNPTDAEVRELPLYCQADLRPRTVKAPGTAAYGCGE